MSTAAASPASPASPAAKPARLSTEEWKAAKDLEFKAGLEAKKAAAEAEKAKAAAASEKRRAAANARLKVSSTGQVIESSSLAAQRSTRPGAEVVEELLLVASVLGTRYRGELVLNENILEWLRDLQLQIFKDRASKADFCPACVYLGELGVAREKLLPIAFLKRDDPDVLQTLSKIFVQLTTPLTLPAQQAGLLNINVKSKKLTAETVRDQALYRQNALDQARHLLAYKKLFCGEGALGVFVEYLRPALETPEHRRGDYDNQVRGGWGGASGWGGAKRQS
jgi:hypothetical protein